MTDKIEQFWRDATAEDIAKVMRGEKVEARFRDDTFDKWAVALLGGYGAMSEGFNWINMDGDCYAHCQVYEPQQWWLDKPDPGEGWRLLDPFTDEQPAVGDCIFSKTSKRWFELKANLMPGRRPEAWYRRRIESKEEVQYAMDRCGVPTIKICDVAQIAGQSPVAANNEFRKFVDKAQAGELSFTCTFLWDGNEFIRVKVGDRIQHPNGCCIDITETGFKVNATLDTVEFGK
jgi:hypothetical protein